MPEPLQLEKLSGQALAATSHTGHPQSRLFFATDAQTHTKFLVNTESEVSIISPTPVDISHSPNPRTLTAVTNTAITTYGQCSLKFNLGLRCLLPWIFVIADVQKPIIGADFPRHYRLMIDICMCKLLDTYTYLKVQGVSSPQNSLLVRPSVSQIPAIPTRNSFWTSLLSLKSLSPIFGKNLTTLISCHKCPNLFDDRNF